jgi:hypothetical protein
VKKNQQTRGLLEAFWQRWLIDSISAYFTLCLCNPGLICQEESDCTVKPIQRSPMTVRPLADPPPLPCREVSVIDCLERQSTMGLSRNPPNVRLDHHRWCTSTDSDMSLDGLRAEPSPENRSPAASNAEAGIALYHPIVGHKRIHRSERFVS